MKTNFPPNRDAQSPLQKLTKRPSGAQFAPALHYKVDRTTNSRHFCLPSKNITRAMPPDGFLDQSESCLDRSVWSSRDVNHTETAHRQCPTGGGNRLPITTMTANLSKFLLVGTAGVRNLSGHKSASLKAADQSRDKTLCNALWAHPPPPTNAFRHC